MKYHFTDWEQDDCDPDRYYLTIRDPDEEEMCIIVHCEVGGRFPLDGPVADGKTYTAEMICEALNYREEYS